VSGDPVLRDPPPLTGVFWHLPNRSRADQSLKGFRLLESPFDPLAVLLEQQPCFLVLPGLARSCRSSDKISITRDPGAGSGFMKKAARSMKCRHTTRSRKLSMSTCPKSVSTRIGRFFQIVNKAGTALSGRALNRYNAWAAIRNRARNAGFLTPVGATLARDRCDGLPGEWRPARACPADGCA
jgi:hypothetical protein